ISGITSQMTTSWPPFARKAATMQPTGPAPTTAIRLAIKSGFSLFMDFPFLSAFAFQYSKGFRVQNGDSVFPEHFNGPVVVAEPEDHDRLIHCKPDKCVHALAGNSRVVQRFQNIGQAPGNVGDQCGNDLVGKGGQLQFHENPPGLSDVGHQQPELAECPCVHQVQGPEVYSRITQSGGNLVKPAWRILNGYDKLLELHKILS